MKRTIRAATVAGASVFGWLIAGGIALAQTTATTTPGVPSTGAGGDTVTNIAILAAAASVAIGGAWYLSRQWAEAGSR